jgi:hypothetical protein
MNMVVALQFQQTETQVSWLAKGYMADMGGGRRNKVSAASRPQPCAASVLPLKLFCSQPA